MWLGVLHGESSKRLAPPLDVAWGVAVCMIMCLLRACIALDFDLVSLALHCCLRLPCAGLIVVLIPGCVMA